MSEAQKERLSKFDRLMKQKAELEAQLGVEAAKKRDKDKADDRARNHAVGEAVRAEMERDAGFRREITALLDRSLKTKHHRGLFGLTPLAEEKPEPVENGAKPKLHLTKPDEEAA